MNLVMIEVLPTLWSPRNTSLYFASGALPLEDALAAGAPFPFALIVAPRPSSPGAPRTHARTHARTQRLP